MRGNLKSLVAFTGCVALFAFGCVALPGLAFADNHDHSMATPAVKQVEHRGAPSPSKMGSRAHPHPGDHHAPPAPPPPRHHNDHRPPPPPHHAGHHPPPPPPPEDHVVRHSEGSYVHHPHEDSLRSKAIGLLVGGGITLFMGGGLGIRALTMDEKSDTDHKGRLAVGISGACLFGLGAILVGFGGYYLYEWKTGDYAFSVTPTFNGAVFNMRF